MQKLKHQSLKAFNTFAIDTIAPVYLKLNSSEELNDIFQEYKDNFYILGQGSNTLFIGDVTPTIIQPNFKGVRASETEHHFLFEVAAGESWHDLVLSTVQQGIGGLENLALIPGTVGAAPVQNIGAYGVELADYCESVTWFDFKSLTFTQLSKEDCNFGYRDSIFKNDLKGKGLITAVQLALPKHWQSNLGYAGLDELDKQVSALQIMEKVIEIRQSKLPNPANIANAGSFFKNPVVSERCFAQLLKKYPAIPHYRLNEHEVKLAAGWLIDQTGLKGYSVGTCGVHNKQALVLVNLGEAKGKDIVKLAQYVVAQVQEVFSVNLVPEVRLISASGEVKFEELPSYV